MCPPTRNFPEASRGKISRAEHGCPVANRREQKCEDSMATQPGDGFKVRIPVCLNPGFPPLSRAPGHQLWFGVGDSANWVLSEPFPVLNEPTASQRSTQKHEALAGPRRHGPRRSPSQEEKRRKGRNRKRCRQKGRKSHSGRVRPERGSGGGG